MFKLWQLLLPRAGSMSKKLRASCKVDDITFAALRRLGSIAPTCAMAGSRRSACVWRHMCRTKIRAHNQKCLPSQRHHRHLGEARQAHQGNRQVSTADRRRSIEIVLRCPHIHGACIRSIDKQEKQNPRPHWPTSDGSFGPGHGRMVAVHALACAAG